MKHAKAPDALTDELADLARLQAALLAVVRVCQPAWAVVEVDGHPVVPRHLFHALFEPQVRRDVVEDICLIRVYAIGRKAGQPASPVMPVIAPSLAGR